MAVTHQFAFIIALPMLDTFMNVEHRPIAFPPTNGCGIEMENTVKVCALASVPDL